MTEDLNEEYESFVHTNEYDYGEFFEKINFSKRVVENSDESHIIQGLSEMFYQEFADQFPERHTRKNAFDDAETLVSGNKNTNYISFRGKKGLFEAVKEAVSLGYVWDFIIDVPWHASFFFNENEIYTFPFQHRFVVLYTGQARHIFFDEFGKHDLLREDSFNSVSGVSSAEDWVEYIAKEKDISVQKIREKVHEICSEYEGDMPEGAAVNRLAKNFGLMQDYRNPDSILNQGALFTGNQHVEDEEKSSTDGMNEIAVWLAFIDKARDYPANDEGSGSGKSHPKLYDKSVVLEVETPSKWLAIKGHKSAKHPRLENIDDCFDSYSNPMEMSQDLSRDDEWVVPNSTGRLPVHYIKSVWDKEDFNSPYFMSIESFVDFMNQKFPERMPQGETHVESGDVSKKELEHLEEEFEILDKVVRNCSHAQEHGERLVSKFKVFQKGIYELEEISENISKLNEGKTDEVLRDDIEYQRDCKRRTINSLSNKAESVFKQCSERNIRLDKIKEALESLGFNMEMREISLSQYIEFMKSDRHLPEKLIEAEVMSVHKEAGQKWENDKHGSEVIIEKMETDLENKANNLFKLNISPQEVYQLLDTSNLQTEPDQKVKQIIEKEYRDK